MSLEPATIINALHSAAPGQPADSIAALVGLLVNLAGEQTGATTTPRTPVDDNALTSLLTSLAGRRLRAGNAQLSFGAGNQIGDVTIDTIAGGDVVTITVQIVAPAAAYNVHGLKSPYIGLQPFTYAARERYAGRATLAADWAARITASGTRQTLLFVTGASGSGKSSFAQAGLLPALEAHYREQEIATRWAVDRLGERPLRTLAGALRKIGVPAAGPFAPLKPLLVGPIAPSAPGTVGLLVIDQFEELFTLANPDERAALFAMLAALPLSDELSLHIICTLRVDYLPELFAAPALYERAKQDVELRAMSFDELREAVQQPLRHAYPNCRFEPALVDQLARDAAQDAAYLPLLQVTLDELWNNGSLTLAHYRSLGGAIQRRADCVLSYRDYDAGRAKSRPQAEQEDILALLLELVDVSLDGDTKRDVRRRRALADLVRGDPRRIQLIRELTKARLLSTDLARARPSLSDDAEVEEGADAEAEETEVVALIHETLITNWAKLRTAIAADRLQLQKRARFELAIRDWRADPERLLTGKPLTEAEELAWRDDVVLRSQDARALLKLSIERREQQRHRELLLERRGRLRLQGLVLLLAGLVAWGGSYLGSQEWHRQQARNGGQLQPLRDRAANFEQAEVTNERYAHCVAAQRCTPPSPALNPTYYDGDGDVQAVRGVDAIQATTFCAWIGRRLPTLADWQYAAGQVERSDWAPGTFAALVDGANWLPPGAASVGRLLPASDPASATPDGVRDLLGNVWEWTRTEWSGEDDTIGSEWSGDLNSFAALPARLIAAGGSFNMTSTAHHTVHQYGVDYRAEDLGFRCAA